MEKRLPGWPRLHKLDGEETYQRKPSRREQVPKEVQER